MPPKAPNAKKSRGGDPPGARRRVENDDDDGDNNTNSNSAATATAKQAHPATLHIPSIGRILRFAAPTFQRAQELSTVCDTWNEVVRHFSKTFWENKLNALSHENLLLALSTAAENGWIEVLIQILPRILPAANTKNASAAAAAPVLPPQLLNTLLFRAASKGRANVCQLLVECGADVNAVSSQAASPLLAAIRRNSLDTVRVIARKENVNAPVELPYSIYHQREIFISPLFAACFFACSGELIKLLLDLGADPNNVLNNQRSSGDPTPLMIVAKKNNVAAVSALLARGANVHATHMHTGHTALHYAAIGGGKRSAELLVNAGAKVGALDKDKNTPLMLARANKSAAVTSLLESRL